MISCAKKAFSKRLGQSPSRRQWRSRFNRRWRRRRSAKSRWAAYEDQPRGFGPIPGSWECLRDATDINASCPSNRARPANRTRLSCESAIRPAFFRSREPLWYPGFVRKMYTFFGRARPKDLSEMPTNIGQTTLPHRGPNLDLRRSILDRIKRDKSIRVWTPNDFLDLGARSAIDKALQRLAIAGDIRRIDRGL